jgi:ABC-type branched-subunit amino acid transport system permease subunit
VLVRMLGLASLIFFALTAYFVAVALYLDGHVYGEVDRALVTGLRVLAGASAVPAVICGFSALHIRDRAILRAEAVAREADPAGT